MAQTINSRQLELDNSSTRTTISTITLTTTDTEFFLQESTNTVFPNNIVISSSITAITAPSYVWSYRNSGQTSYTVITGQIGNSLTVTNTAFSTYLGSATSVTFKVDVSQKGFISSSDTVTISYRKEVDDVIQTVLSNPNILVLTNDQGTPLTLSNTGTSLQVIQNGRYIPYSPTANNSFRVGTPIIAPTNSITLGSTSSTTTSFSYGDISSITSDNVSVTHPIIVKNKAGTDRTTINVVQKYIKVKGAASGITVNLTNESHNIPTDSAGVNPVYTNSGTSIYVYDGTTQLDYDGIGTAAGKWTVSAIGTNINPGSVSDGGTYATYGDVSNITADTAFIAFTITGKTPSGATFTLVKTQTFVKVKSGTNPIIYSISLSSPIISKLSPNAATSGAHSSITIQGKKRDGNTTTNFGWVTVTPNGSSEATTATDTSSAPVTLTPANGDGKTSYTIKLYNQAAVNSAVLLDTQTVPVIFKGDTGEPGAPGTKFITVSCFNWLNISLTVAPSATATYNWSAQSVTGFPTSPSVWSSSAQSSPGTGYTLYRLDVIINAAGDFTGITSFNWNTASINIVGFRQDGAQGKGARVAFIVTTSNTVPTIISSTVSGDSLPSTTGGTWSTTATSNLSAGQYLYQVDGLYDPITLTTTWGNPYLSNLKVGSLSAITVNTGQLTFDETGNIKSANNTGYDTTGVFLGYSTNNYKVSVVSGSNKLTFDGTDLTITGKINAGSFITGSVQLDNSSGTSLSTIASNASSALNGLTTKLEAGTSYTLTGVVGIQDTGGIRAGTVTWDSTTGTVTGGSGVVLTENGLTGVKNGTPTFSINTNGDATFAGSLDAATGTFAGTLSAAGGSFTGTMTVGTDNTVFKVNSDGSFQSGHATFASAPFRVTNTGVLTATSATITGTLAAGSFITGSVQLDNSSGTSLSTIASNASSALNGLTTKLEAGTSYTLTGVVGIQDTGGIRAGTVTWDSTTGTVTGGSGVVLTENGLTGVKNGTPTFSINTNGDATFAGSLDAATGTLGRLDITNGAINAGTFVSIADNGENGWGWPSTSGVGFHLGPNGLLLGSAAVNDSPFIQLSATGYFVIGKRINNQNITNLEFNPNSASLFIKGTVTAGSIIADTVTLSSGTALSTIESNAAAGLSANNNLVNKLDKQSSYILGTNANANQIALQTQNYVDTNGATGLVITNTGILGRKEGTTTFAIDNSGSATFVGTITASAGAIGGIEIYNTDSETGIRSTNYSSTTGFAITSNGFAVLRFANIGGINVSSSQIYSTNYSATNKTGFQIAENGYAEFFDLSVRGQINGGAFTTFGWPASGTGFHLGPSGLLLGNKNTGAYVNMASTGYVEIGYTTTPKLYFDPANGNLSITGSISSGGLDVATGSIRGGKSSYNDSASGFFLAKSGSDGILSIGNANTFLKWNGSSLLLQGASIDIKSSTANDRMEITSNSIKVYSGGVVRVRIGNLTA